MSDKVRIELVRWTVLFLLIFGWGREMDYARNHAGPIERMITIGLATFAMGAGMKLIQTALTDPQFRAAQAVSKSLINKCLVFAIGVIAFNQIYLRMTHRA